MTKITEKGSISASKKEKLKVDMEDMFSLVVVALLVLTYKFTTIKIVVKTNQSFSK